MSRIQELKEQLEQIYALPCPVCGHQWTYEITSETSWKEIRNCGCSEYFKLIEERKTIYSPLKRQE
ncbi:MAG: phage terminase large subunit family protein [Bacteroidales bacterium]|nr:phage terminase large subunit family protein [Bacteroidales bacterium]